MCDKILKNKKSSCWMLDRQEKNKTKEPNIFNYLRASERTMYTYILEQSIIKASVGYPRLLPGLCHMVYFEATDTCVSKTFLFHFFMLLFSWQQLLFLFWQDANKDYRTCCNMYVEKEMEAKELWCLACCTIGKNCCFVWWRKINSLKTM